MAKEVSKTTVDEVMSKNPLDMLDKDIDFIIAYQRNLRARSVDGKKPVSEEALKLDVDKLLGTKPQPKGSSGHRRV